MTSVSASSCPKDSEPNVVGQSAKESLRKLSNSQSKDLEDAIELDTISVTEGPVIDAEAEELPTFQDM